MPEHAPRRPLPALSKLSQEVMADNPEEEPPLFSKDHLTPPRPIALNSSGRSSPSSPSFGYNTPYDIADDGVNVPLLPLHAPQTVRLPLTRNVSTEQIVRIDVPHLTGSERGKDNKRLSDHRWTILSPDDTEYDSPRRRLSSSSAEAQCAIETPSPSPNSSRYRYFDTTPPFTSTLGRFPKPQARHPFAKNFEVPQWRKLAMHTGLCVLSYPFLLIFVIMGQGQNLFWSRLLVGAGCGIVGVMLGLSLVQLARGVLEAATWATVIHQSQIPDTHGVGVRLKDLAAHSDTSSWAALRLLWDRRSYPGADREYRRFYDARKWSIWIIFFLLNVILSGTMSFLLGRAVDIDIQVVHQQREYHEVIVSGDLSDDDLERATNIQDAFNDNTLTWTLAPFSSHGELPPVLSLKWENEPVFFSEVIHSQLTPNGSGFGTFDLTTTAPSLDIGSQDLMVTASKVGVETGSVLRFPRWGIRIKCTKIPDINLNLVPFSKNNFTYLFTPRSTIRALFDHFNLSHPQGFEQPFNFPTFVYPGDPLPSGLNKTGIYVGAKFWNNGVAHSMFSDPLSQPGNDGKGFITVENILVRLNTSFAPNGTFGLKSDQSVPDKDGVATFIGYDAAVCLELYEPWVLEVYNSSVGFPSSMRIVDKAAEIKDMNTEQLKEKRLGKPVSGPLVKRALNSTNMTAAYNVGHQNSVNQIIKDNGRDVWYIPSPTLVSFTGGNGLYGYTELSEVYYAKARALADASNVLPYFAGSGLVVARRYDDQIVTSPVINNVFLCLTILAAFLMGLISALFVPRLPRDIPRRGFDLYSWLSAFHAHELVAVHPAGISKDMDLRDIQDYTSTVEVMAVKLEKYAKRRRKIRA